MDLSTPDYPKTRLARCIGKGYIQRNELKSIADAEEVGAGISPRLSVLKVRIPFFSSF